MATRGWQGVTQRDLTQKLLAKQQPRSKYNARKTTVDNIVFDSAKEAKRYEELKVLQAGKQLHALMVHHRRPLLVYAKDAPEGHPLKKIGDYEMDFLYCTCAYPDSCQGANPVVEDVKGFRTALYKWKKKHFEAQYGLQIREL
jgi:hypothetical protein